MPYPSGYGGELGEPPSYQGYGGPYADAYGNVYYTDPTGAVVYQQPGGGLGPTPPAGMVGTTPPPAPYDPYGYQGEPMAPGLYTPPPGYVPPPPPAPYDPYAGFGPGGTPTLERERQEFGIRQGEALTRGNPRGVTYEPMDPYTSGGSPDAFAYVLSLAGYSPEKSSEIIGGMPSFQPPPPPGGAPVVGNTPAGPPPPGQDPALFWLYSGFGPTGQPTLSREQWEYDRQQELDKMFGAPTSLGQSLYFGGYSDEEVGNIVTGMPVYQQIMAPYGYVPTPEAEPELPPAGIPPGEVPIPIPGVDIGAALAEPPIEPQNLEQAVTGNVGGALPPATGLPTLPGGAPGVRGRYLPVRETLYAQQTADPILGLYDSLFSLSGQEPTAGWSEFAAFLPQGRPMPLSSFVPSRY